MDLGWFMVSALALIVAPGPDLMMVLAQGMTHGRSAAVFTALGLATGCLLHTALVALGAAALLQTSDALFNALKYAGAAYLLWLAWQAFRNRAEFMMPERVPGGKAWQLYRRGIVMNALNPKVSMFFLAFLPQFVNSESPSTAMNLAELGLIFALMTAVVFSLGGMVAAWIGNKLRRNATARRLLGWLTATVFAAIGLRLLLLQR